MIGWLAYFVVVIFLGWWPSAASYGGSRADRDSVNKCQCRALVLVRPRPVCDWLTYRRDKSTYDVGFWGNAWTKEISMDPPTCPKCGRPMSLLIFEECGEGPTPHWECLDHIDDQPPEPDPRNDLYRPIIWGS